MANANSANAKAGANSNIECFREVGRPGKGLIENTRADGPHQFERVVQRSVPTRCTSQEVEFFFEFHDQFYFVQ